MSDSFAEFVARILRVWDGFMLEAARHHGGVATLEDFTVAVLGDDQLRDYLHMTLPAKSQLRSILVPHAGDPASKTEAKEDAHWVVDPQVFRIIESALTGNDLSGVLASEQILRLLLRDGRLRVVICATSIDMVELEHRLSEGPT